jgi:hypothetical protein
MHLMWFCAFSPHAGFGLDGWAGPRTTDPIYFTNILFDGWLYIITYLWPDTVPPAKPACDCLGRLSLDALR